MHGVVMHASDDEGMNNVLMMKMMNETIYLIKMYYHISNLHWCLPFYVS